MNCFEECLKEMLSGSSEGLAKHLDDDPLLIHSVDGNGENLLVYAVELGNIEMVQLLLNRGADIGSRALGRSTLIQQAIKECDSETAVRLIRLLVEHGANPDDIGYLDMSALQIAAYLGKKIIVEELLKSGADVRMKSKVDGNTAAMEAVEQGYEDVAALLIKAERIKMGRGGS